jgi:hypothetical protein
MSAQLFPSSPESTPSFAHPAPTTTTFTVVPPGGAVTGEATATGNTGATFAAGLPEPVKAVLRHPVVVAGGAIVAGVVLSRVFGTAAGRKIARELAAEAVKHLRPAATTAAGMAGTAAASTLLERGLEKFGPQITDYAKKMLADILRKKE